MILLLVPAILIVRAKAHQQRTEIVELTHQLTDVADSLAIASAFRLHFRASLQKVTHGAVGCAQLLEKLSHVVFRAQRPRTCLQLEHFQFFVVDSVIVQRQIRNGKLRVWGSGYQPQN
uniref:Putative secreted peptide n=1 Tax=Anopheles braziliensis TaxID=58242 RepID=A0A2M3ZTQ3_9DIPT